MWSADPRFTRRVRRQLPLLPWDFILFLVRTGCFGPVPILFSSTTSSFTVLNTCTTILYLDISGFSKARTSVRTCMGGKCTLIGLATGLLIVGLALLFFAEVFTHHFEDNFRWIRHGLEQGARSPQESQEAPYESQDIVAAVPFGSVPLYHNCSLAVNHNAGRPSLEVAPTWSSSKTPGIGSHFRYGTRWRMEVSNLQAEAGSISTLLPDMWRTLDCCSLRLAVHGHSLDEPLMGCQGTPSQDGGQTFERATTAVDAAWQISAPRTPAEYKGVSGAERAGQRQSSRQGQRRVQAWSCRRDIALAECPASTADSKSSSSAQSRCPSTAPRGVRGAAPSGRALATLCSLWYVAGFSTDAVAAVSHSVWTDRGEGSPSACQIPHRCQTGTQPVGAGAGSLRTGLACLCRSALRTVFQAGAGERGLSARSARSYGSVDAEGQDGLCCTHNSCRGWIPAGRTSPTRRRSVGHGCRRSEGGCRCGSRRQIQGRRADKVPHGGVPWCSETGTGSQCGPRTHSAKARQGQLSDRALRRRSRGQSGHSRSGLLHAAPCLSPAPSLLGLVGRTQARLWQGTGLLHSSRNHDDFCTPWLASLRGLLMQFEVIAEEDERLPRVRGGFDDITGQQSSVVLWPLQLRCNAPALAHWHRQAFYHQDGPSLTGMPDGARAHMDNLDPIEPQCKPFSEVPSLMSPPDGVRDAEGCKCTAVQSSVSARSSTLFRTRSPNEGPPFATLGSVQAEGIVSLFSKLGVSSGQGKGMLDASFGNHINHAGEALVKGGSCRPFPVDASSLHCEVSPAELERSDSKHCEVSLTVRTSCSQNSPGSSSVDLVKGGSCRPFPDQTALALGSAPASVAASLALATCQLVKGGSCRTFPAEDQWSNVRIYTDGSFCPQTLSAAWAICVLLCCRGQWTFAGFASDGLYVNGQHHSLGQPHASAHVAELTAMAAAAALVGNLGRMRDGHVEICFDAIAAAGIAEGRQWSRTLESFSLGVTALMHLAQQRSGAVCWRHVRAHQGDPMNELADSAAKAAATAAFRAPISADHLAMVFAAPETPYLWWTPGRTGLPDVDSCGIAVIGECPTPDLAALDFSDRVPGSRSTHWSIRLVTYNCLSLVSVAQKKLPSASVPRPWDSHHWPSGNTACL